MERICSRSSGVSWWPCTVLAWSTARSRTSSSVPEMTMEQGFSAGKRRQSMTLRVSAIVPPLNRPDYRLVVTRVQPKSGLGFFGEKSGTILRDPVGQKARLTVFWACGSLDKLVRGVHYRRCILRVKASHFARDLVRVFPAVPHPS